LFAPAEIPWDELAFKTVKETLVRYFSPDRLPLYEFSISLPPKA
jgi:hypothetical protein